MNITNQNIISTEYKNIYKPYKIIYRYRNNNRKFQYCYYVFVGNVPNNIKRIINKFINLNFIKTLIELSPDEIDILEDYYGIYWYENFFISSYLKKIRKTFNSINEKEKITKKLGIEWIEKHIKLDKKSNLVYSYTGKIKIDRLKKQYFEEKEQMGGSINKNIVNKYDDDQDDQSINTDDEDDNNDEDDKEKEEKEEIIEEEFEEKSNEDLDFDINQLEEMHLINEDIDKDAEKTKKMLNTILEDEAERNKIRKERNIPFDNSLDTLNYHGDIDDVYDKKIIYSQFIYSDDTILNIKKKICISIEKDKKF